MSVSIQSHSATGRNRVVTGKGFDMGQGKNAANAMTAMLLTLMVGFLAACSPPESRSPVVVRAVGPRTQGQAQPDTSNLPGRIYSSASYQHAFEEAVKGLLSTDIRPEYIGYVSATGENGSGVFFGGQVRLVNGSITSGFGGTIANDSHIIIQVRDYIPNMSNVPILPAIQLRAAQGQVSGNYAQIVFYDGYGMVQLTGYIDIQRQLFTGIVKYDNYVLYDGSRPGAAGTLGDFSIPLCSFFAC